MNLNLNLVKNGMDIYYQLQETILKPQILPIKEFKRPKCSLQYAIKLVSQTSSLQLYFQIPIDIETVTNKKNIIKPFGFRIQENLKEINFAEKMYTCTRNTILANLKLHFEDIKKQNCHNICKTF